jgi:hypothetical protein
MAFVVQWDVSFNSRPLNTEPLGNGYTEIQKTRSAVAERIANEHSFNLNDALNTNQGKHLQGSARIFVSDTEPVVPSIPIADDGTFELGRVLFKPTVKEFLVRSAGAWVSILKMAADAIFNNIQATIATITTLNSTTMGTTDLTAINLTITNLNASATPVHLGSGVTGTTPVVAKFGQGIDYRPVEFSTEGNGAVALYVGGLLVSGDYAFDAPVKGDATVSGTLRVGASKVPVRGITISSSDPSGGDDGNLWIKV